MPYYWGGHNSQAHHQTGQYCQCKVVNDIDVLHQPHNDGYKTYLEWWAAKTLEQLEPAAWLHNLMYANAANTVPLQCKYSNQGISSDCASKHYHQEVSVRSLLAATKSVQQIQKPHVWYPVQSTQFKCIIEKSWRSLMVKTGLAKRFLRTTFQGSNNNLPGCFDFVHIHACQRVYTDEIWLET